MGFYEDFIEKYDTLVSWETRKKREAPFFKALFTKHRVKSVLDCACGTGHHAVLLELLGYEVKGSDLSPAMIRKARLTAKEHKATVPFKVSDFRNLTKTFPEKFDAVICVGNSLPHLLSDKDLTKALDEFYKVLNKDGILVLQQRNYDMLVSTQKRFMPMSLRKDEAFFYVLDYFPNKIVFNIVDVELKTNSFNVYRTEYSPLKKDRLARLLRKSGFKNLRFYGNFRFKKFDIKTDDYLIVVCEK